MTLDNGQVVELVPNEGAICCNAGIYAVQELLACDHIITSVKLEKTDLNLPKKQYKGKKGKKPQRADMEDGYLYELFVFAEDSRLRLAAVEGDDGNGCYGTGFTLRVRPV